MQNVVLDEPYVLVPPKHGAFWSNILRHVLPGFLRKSYGVVQFEYQHLERLQASLRAGHGIVLMPNHSRDEDGLVMGMLSCKIGRWFYYMSSWHLLKGGFAKAFFLPRVGVYSVYREGPDRASVKLSVDLIARARRPVVIFPEGYLARTNDRLSPLMDGPSLIARAAAKKRAQANPPGQVVVHPVALRYQLLAPLEPAVTGVLAELEARFQLPDGAARPLRERVDQIGAAMLARYETEHLGAPQAGPLPPRRTHLVNFLLRPLEDEWIGCRHDDDPVQFRVRQLRVAIVPGLTQGGLDEAERRRRWRQLTNIYLAQMLDNYPADYLAGEPSPERLLETIERYQEDSTDVLRPFGPLKATITIGEPIVVHPVRENRGGEEPLLQEVRTQLAAMLGLSQSAPATARPAAVPR
ncbi:MAG TPA: 1-acyl-sn-glycerol-3-phosphate acyltransferase [Opitutales bacterium]|nr:1-acyl-sn-glycerol-3-phosphate acyltransferase [Opitutales bacterium]